MFDNQITASINANTYITREDKMFLTQVLVKLNPLEKLKLKSLVSSDEQTTLVSGIELLKIKFPPEVKVQSGFFSKISQFINPPKPQKIVSPSILSSTQALGGPIPVPFPANNVGRLDTSEAFYDLAQLAFLDQSQFGNGTEQQEDVNLQKFLEKIDGMFETVPKTETKRSYFASFVTSPMFNAYMNTGLTAIRHPEIEPREIILNTLHLTNSNYLDKRKFEIASIITNYLRHLCGI
jgi:hypothetical protein